MASYQFIHIEGYARVGSVQRRNSKTTRVWSIHNIAREAMRFPGYHPHVPVHKPPIIIHGTSPLSAVNAAVKWAEATKDAIGRKLRRDGLCLLTGVVSIPADFKVDWEKFKIAVLNFLILYYGERLKSVVEHTDEAHPHVHFYVVPKIGDPFCSVHPGMRAALTARADGKLKGIQNSAYKTAMVDFQDHFYDRVAQDFQLERAGPRRRRLTRAEWRVNREKELQQLHEEKLQQQELMALVSPEKINDELDLSQLAALYERQRSSPNHLRENIAPDGDSTDSGLNIP